MNKFLIIAAKDNISEIKEILKILTPDVKADFSAEESFKKPESNGPEEIRFVFNYDDIDIRKTLENFDAEKISFGFLPEADFFASDKINTEEGISFKLNHKGSSVPIWIKSPFSDRKIYNVLAAVCVAAFSGLNIVEISDKLKNK